VFVSQNNTTDLLVLCDCVQLTYQSVQWKGEIAIEADPPHLSVASFETTKDGEKLTLVSRTSCSLPCYVILEHY